MTTSPSKARLLNRYGLWLKWAIAVAILGGLIYKNRETFQEFSLEELRWGFAVAGFVAVLIALLCTFLRWLLLVRAQEFELSLNESLRLSFLGYAFNYLLPGAISGDFVKAGVLAMRQKTRRAVAFATIILDRLLGLIALFVVGGLVWFAQTDDMQHPVFHSFALVFGIGTAVGISGLAIALHTPLLQARWMEGCKKWKLVGGFLDDMLHAVAQYRSKAGVVWLTFGISLIGHLFMLTAFYVCALAMNPAADVPGFFAHLLFMPVAELAGMIPIVPGGVGVLEAATARFYTYAGYESGDGTLTGISFRVVSITIAILGAGYGFSARRKFQQVMEDTPETGGVKNDVSSPIPRATGG